MQLLGGIGIALVVWFGGSQVLSGASTPGTFFSFLTALIMIYEPLKGISRVNSVLQQGIAAAERVFDVLDVERDVEEKKGAVKLPKVKELIEFKDARFQYDPKTEVLKGINLQVKTGEVLALVGPSGGGKSTLVNLIPRFFDVSSGFLTIDGRDIRDVTLRSLRNQIGMVTQQTILFNDTVRNNIAYGSQNATYEQVKEAARAAHALDFIQQLPEGFDTVIGESGARLSGGERQRISIARAILKNAPILILDEATSSLDTESEWEVQQAIENLVQSRTTFVIAHRLSTIRNADRIIVIQEGRIVEEGTHDSLLPLEGVYKMLYDMQFQDDAMELQNAK
jgi:subfamily B ATP-binding cassette protein MsbA